MSSIIKYKSKQDAKALSQVLESRFKKKVHIVKIGTGKVHFYYALTMDSFNYYCDSHKFEQPVLDY